MDAFEVMDEVSDKQGWDLASRLNLALGFIQREGKADEFMAFLSYAAEKENEDA